MTNLTLYVPRPQSFAHQKIKAGSACVGRPYSMSPADKSIDLHFEGSLYGSAPSFEEKVSRAAIRCSTSYPTIAHLIVEEGDLIPVGTVTMPGPHHGVQYSIYNEEAFQAWITAADEV